MTAAVIVQTPPTPIAFTDTFGIADVAGSVTGWTQGGGTVDITGVDNTPVTEDTTRDGTASNKFARIASNGSICRTFDASDDSDLYLSYFWKGDSQTEAGLDFGIVEYRVGDCTSGSPSWTQLASHSTNDNQTSWSDQEVVDLPGALDGSTFSLRFRTASSISQGDEAFRVDQVVVEPFGHLTVYKVTDPGSDLTNFEITATGGDVIGNPVRTLTSGTPVSYIVLPGTYDVTETSLAGWDETDNDCDSVVVTAGSTATCTITNVQRGHIIVDKVTLGGDDTFSFDASGGVSPAYADFTLTGAQAPNDQTLKPGAYSVVEGALAGWDPTSASCTSDLNGSENPSAIDLNAGETVTCTFTNTKHGSISGHKYIDTDGDGVLEVGETTGVEGVTIALFDGSATTTTTTGPGGAYTFSGLLPDTYTVTESAPAGSVQTTSNPAPIALVAGENVTDIDFGNFYLVTVTGIKYDDKNGDGQKQIDEPGIENWHVALGRVGQPTPQIPIEIVQLQLTGAGGQYQFTDVGPGHYIVLEEQRNGWVPMAPQVDSFFDVFYQIQNPPPFPTADSFFDIFVDVSGIPVNQGQPSVDQPGNGVGPTPGPLAFGNFKLITVTVQKDVVSPSSGAVSDTHGFSIDLDGGTPVALAEGTDAVFNGVGPGSHTLTEAADSDYVVSAPVPFTAVSGVDQTIIVTNTQKTGTITVTKNTVGGDGTFTLVGPNGNFDITTSAGTGSSIITVVPGTGYAVTETTPDGWDETYNDCSGITVGSNGGVGCTIVNTKRGHIIVDKVTNPVGATQLFDFTTSYGNFSLTDTDAPHDSGALIPGTYTLSEDAVGGWSLDSASCDDGSILPNVDVAAGETVTCTFTNKDIEAPVITVTGDDEFDVVYGVGYTGEGATAVDNVDTSVTVVVSGTVDILTTTPVGTYTTYYDATDVAGNGAVQKTRTIHVTVKPITVTPDAGQSKVFGAANPTYTYAHTPLVVPDVFTGALDRALGEDVGTYAFSLGTLSAGANYLVTLAPETFAVIEADADCTITGYSGTYDGAAHGATGACTGVGGPSDVLSGLDLGSSFTDVPGGTANWTFSNPNYLPEAGSVPIELVALSLVGSFTADNKTYDGNDSATVLTRSLATVIAPDVVTLDGGTATFDSANAGVGKAVTLAGATLGGVDAGNYSLGSVTPTTADMHKANAIIVVTPYNVIYDGDSHTVVGTATGVLAELLSGLVVTDTTHTAAGDYPADAWTFTDITGNYNDDTGAVHDVIELADVICVVDGYAGVYDGDPHGASGTCTGVGGEDRTGDLDLGASFTDVPGGTAHWTFTDTTGNYGDQAGDVPIVITQAVADIDITGYSVTYDGLPHTATGVVTGVNAEDLSLLLDLSGTTHTDAGSYSTDPWTFAGNTNYAPDAGTVADSIGQAESVTVVTCPTSETYTGSPIEPCTAEVTGIGGLAQSLPVVYGNNTDVGTATADASFAGDVNHTASADSETFDITQGGSVTTITCPASVIYTGSAQTPCTGIVTGAGGLNLDVTASLIYTNNTNVGTATASYTYAGDANHAGSSDSRNFAITKATSSITITNDLDLAITDSVVGETVTVAWAVTLTPTGGTPTGTVTVKNGGTPVCSAPVGDGTCTVSPVFSFPQGTSLQAVYSGDANVTGSISTPVVPHTVVKANTTTAITNAAELATNTTVGDSYTVEWDVAVVAPGASPITGTVTVTGGSGCSAPVADGECTLTSTEAGAKTLVATYGGDSNLNGSASAGTPHTVDKGVLTITADDKSKVYGETDPAFTFTPSGFIGGVDSVIDDAPVCGVVPLHEDVDTYPIVCAGGSDANYTFDFVDGTLTVSEKGLTVTANDQGKEWGATFSFLGTEFITSALEAGDTVDSVTLTSAGASSGAAVGDHDIVPSDAVGTGLSNYAITYVDGTMTITDTTFPDTTIDTNPGTPTADNTPSFTFSATEASTFICSVDAGPGAPCASPFTSLTLTDGPHTFSVFATDTNGNADASPAEYTFTVDATGPSVAIATPADGSTVDGPEPADATFTVDDGAATVTCEIDAIGAVPCSSSFDLGTLTAGAHLLTVTATDGLGNVGSDSNSFTVELPAVITDETAADATDTTLTITWTTDHPADSRVVYGTSPVVVLGSAPNYGYPNSTLTDPALVTEHSVVIGDDETALTPATTYYYRVVSVGSPIAISDEEHSAVTDQPAPQTATVVMTKIVCKYESDLPNWGNSNAEAMIDENTADEFLAENPNCHLEPDWTFEYAPNGTANPGNEAPDQAGWTTSTPTDENGATSFEIPATAPNALTWFREVLKDGYIAFSGWLKSGNSTPTAEDEVSAEIYCNNDVLNYDNYDWIKGAEAGETYYCVAFNARETIANACPIPDELGDTAFDTIGTSPEGEDTLQEILDDEGYGLSAEFDQWGYQSFTVTPGATVSINPIRFVDKFAGHNQVFGYYVDSDLGTFVPVFKTANFAGSPSVPLMNAGPFSATVPSGATSIGFAIRSYNGDTLTGEFATENALNTAGEDHVLVYNPSAGTYALAFEDLKASQSSDWDYNDLVVEVSLACELPPPPPEGGSITICKLAVDAEGNLITETGNEFTIPGITPDPVTSEGVPAGEIGDSVFESPLTPNADVVPSIEGNDAECVTYSGLDLGIYYYGAETMTAETGWQEPKYNDQFETAIESLSDFFSYNGTLFDGNPVDDFPRNENADGSITLTAERPDRTLVVLNRLEGEGDEGDDEGGDTPPITCDLETHHVVDNECIPNGDDNDDDEEDTVTITSSGGGSTPPLGGGVIGGGGNGQVLGVSTEGQVLGASCGLYMNKHLKQGSPKNDSAQTGMLQAFLIKHGFLKIEKPTNYFGPLTFAAVSAFQAQFADDILKPWGISSPTGLVYLSTLYKINKIECPELTLGFPSLVEWSQNPSAQ